MEGLYNKKVFLKLWVKLKDGWSDDERALKTWAILMNTVPDRIKLDYKTAVVLHHYNYQDNSLIVNFFVQELGKLSAVARGVKNSKKGRYALLQPFSETDYQFKR